MKTCDEYLELISIYLDEGIMNDELESHLALCTNCRDELSAMEHLLLELRELPELPLPEGFHDRTMERLRKEQKSHSTVPFANYVSIAASVILCFILLGGTLTIINNGLVNRTPNYTADELVEWSAEVVAFDLPIVDVQMHLPDDIAGRGADAAAGFGAAMPAPTAAAAPIAAVAEEVPDLLTGMREVDIEERHQDQDMLQPRDRLYFGENQTAVHSSHSSIISRTASLSITVDDMDLAVQTIRMAGFEIESSSVSENFASFTLRVPNMAYEHVRGLALSLGESTFENEFAADLTHATNELAIMYGARLEEGRRLTALIISAQRADDRLILQNRISQIEQDRARIRGSYNQNLERSQNYSFTISFHTEGNVPIYFERTFGERISDAFTGSVNFTTLFFEGILVMFSYTIVPLVLIAVLGAIGYFSFKKFVKRGHKQ